MVSVVQGIPLYRPPRPGNNKQLYMTQAAYDVVSQIPKRPNHIRFFWDSTGPIKEAYGPWVQDVSYVLPSGNKGYRCNLADVLTPNNKGVLRTIVMYTLPDAVFPPTSAPPVPQGLAQRMALSFVNGLATLVRPVGQSIVDAASAVIESYTLGNVKLKDPLSRLIQDFWGQNFGSDEQPDVTSTGKVVMYVVGESLVPIENDPDNPLLDSVSEDWRKGNDLDSIRRSLDRIVSILGAIKQDTGTLAGSQRRIPFLNHLADMLDLIGKMGGAGDGAGQFLRDLLADALAESTSAAIKAALDSLFDSFESTLDLYKDVAETLPAELFERKLDDLIKAIEDSKSQDLTGSLDVVLDDLSTTAILDKYLIDRTVNHLVDGSSVPLS